MNRPCIITIIGITRGKRVARRKTFNKWPFRIARYFPFFPFFPSLPREVIPEQKKEKNGRVNVRLFDCSISQLFRANGCSSIFVTLPLIFQCFFFFKYLSGFCRLVIKCFYEHNNSFFFRSFCYSCYREIGFEIFCT